MEMFAEELMFRWYDHLLKGLDNGTDRKKPVKIFVMGKNVWREEDDWPLARARATPFYLHSDGQANSLAGNGTLSATTPQSEQADKFIYVPMTRCPRKGGNSVALHGAQPSGHWIKDPSRSARMSWFTPAHRSTQIPK